LTRARDVHQRYGDQNGWAETLLVSAAVAVGLRDLDAAEGFMRDAGALTAGTANAYDRTHESVVRALLAAARGELSDVVRHAVEARRGAEAMALAAFHVYAMAIEAAARVDLGEIHAATLVATTALGTVENLQGCEYGLEIRALCADALTRAGSPRAPEVRQRALEYAAALGAAIRDSRLRNLFFARPIHGMLSQAGLALPSQGVATPAEAQ
jgi:hypothetical protein